MKKRIEITIDTEGNTQIEAVGFNGKGCQDATREIERALGIVESVKRKPAYFKPETQTHNRQWTKLS